MVLDIINAKINDFKQHIQDTAEYKSLFKWDALKQFQDNWDLKAEDFKEMYENSFSKNVATRLWEGENFFPKQAMLTMIDYDEEKVRGMFRNLLNEEKDLEARIEFFVYDCNTIRNQILKTNPEFKHHYHGDYAMISIYLAFHYPQKYSIYKYNEFKQFMEAVKSKSIPTEKEITRFFKVMKTINVLISKDEELLAIHKKIREINNSYKEESLLLAQDFYHCSIKLAQ
ncbi:hypothetical protein [Flavicella marina]|uniref:hypothetical protein n=1 Tax=Flavicella marina TaxID=1475951 RepID=UPI00126557ED|nr:hypothetical protein [Flavicella marina]